MIALLNAFPNIALPDAGDFLMVKGINEEEARKMLSEEDFESYVGHQSFADVLSSRLGIDIPLNRSQATCEGTWLIASVQPPRRLAEGEIWTEEEILSMPIKYCVIEFPSEEDKKMFKAFNNPQAINIPYRSEKK